MAGRSLKGVIQVCSAKRRFASAEEVATAIRPGLSSYRCLACGGFHLTSQGGSSSVSDTSDDRKPTFETSVLGRAKGSRANQVAGVRRTVWGECVGSPKADGTVKVRFEGKEFVTTVPVQPAHVRQLLKAGSKVKIEYSQKPLLVRIVSDQSF
jgi:hypothetical protein